MDPHERVPLHCQRNLLEKHLVRAPSVQNMMINRITKLLRGVLERWLSRSWAVDDGVLPGFPSVLRLAMTAYAGFVFVRARTWIAHGLALIVGSVVLSANVVFPPNVSTLWTILEICRPVSVGLRSVARVVFGKAQYLHGA